MAWMREVINEGERNETNEFCRRRAFEVGEGRLVFNVASFFSTLQLLIFAAVLGRCDKGVINGSVAGSKQSAAESSTTQHGDVVVSG